jgi:hypothetical protein
MDLWVSLNPGGRQPGDISVFSDADGLRRILAFAGKLRDQAGITGFILSFDDQPVELREFRTSSATDRAPHRRISTWSRRVAAGLPEGLRPLAVRRGLLRCPPRDGTAALLEGLPRGLPVVPASVGVVWTGPRVLSADDHRPRPSRDPARGWVAAGCSSTTIFRPTTTSRAMRSP